MRLFLLLTGLVALLSQVPAGAAEAGAVETAAAENPPKAELQEDLPYQLRFAAFTATRGGGSRSAGHKFVLATEDWASQPFAIPGNGFSPKVGAPTRSVTLGLSNAEGQLQAVGQIVLPQQGRAFLILLLPDGAEGSAPNIVVIRADDPSFKVGDIQFFNLSDAPVGVKMDEQKVLLQPESHQKVSAPDLPEGVRSYQVEFYTQDNGDTYQFGSTQWVKQTRVRTYLFTYKSPQNGRMSYRAIDEFPSWIRK